MSEMYPHHKLPGRCRLSVVGILVILDLIIINFIDAASSPSKANRKEEEKWNPKVDFNLVAVVDYYNSIENVGLQKAISLNQSQSLVRRLRESSAACSAGQLTINDEGKLQVYLRIREWTEDHKQELTRMGVRIEIEKSEIGIVQCSIPVSRFSETAGLDWIDAIIRPNYGVATASPRDVTQPFQSEGDKWLRLDRYRQEKKFTGEGWKVGVISDGIKGLSVSQAAGELPKSITAKSFLADANLEVGGEGTAILEQVYDSLPGANLYFANAGTDLEFIQAIFWLADHCDVIVCDIAFFGMGPLDGGGYLDRCMSEAAKKVKSFVSSIGNQANGHYRGSYWDPDHNGLHNFSQAREYLNCSVLPRKTISLSLLWDDHFQLERKNSFTMRLVASASGELLAESNSIKNVGGQTRYAGYPAEFLFFENKSDAILKCQLYIVGGNSEARELHVNIFNTQGQGGQLLDFIVPQQSLVNVPIAEGVISSGAYDAYTACTVTGAEYGSEAIGPYAYTLEPFSSFGPTWDGRFVPNVVAPDRIHTFSDFWNWKTTDQKNVNYYPDNSNSFSGTSATPSTVSGYETIFYEDGSISFTVGDQKIYLPSEILEMSNVSNRDSTNGMQLFITAGFGSPDIYYAKQYHALIQGIQPRFEVTPNRISLQVEPGKPQKTILEIRNLESEIILTGLIQYDPRILQVYQPFFQIAPSSILGVTISTVTNLPERQIQTTLQVGAVGNPESFTIPVEIFVGSTLPGSITEIQKQEPNNPANISQVFTHSQLVAFPNTVSESSGDPVLRISGVISTKENGLKGHNQSDDAEDWYQFKLDKEEIVTISATPLSASADLDLFMIRSGGSLAASADHERDGWMETIGPLKLSAGPYAIGVSIYDRNFPNSDGTYTDYECPYQLTIRKKGEKYFMKSVSLPERGDYAIAAGSNAVFWSRRDTAQVLHAVQGPTWEYAGETLGYFPISPQALPQNPGKIGVINDLKEKNSYSYNQVLQIWDFQNAAAPIVSATLMPEAKAASQKIPKFTFSNEGKYAYVLCDQSFETFSGMLKEFNLISFDAANRTQIRELNLPKDGAIRFDVFNDRVMAVYQSFTPLMLYFLDLTNPVDMKVIKEVKPTSNLSANLYTVDPSGKIGFYVLSTNTKTLNWFPLDNNTTNPLSLDDMIYSLVWQPEGNLLLVVMKTALAVLRIEGEQVMVSATIPYPDVGIGKYYHPGSLIFLSQNIAALVIDTKVVWFIDLKTMKGLEYYRTDPHTIQNITTSYNPTGLIIAGLEAVLLSIDPASFGTDSGTPTVFDPQDQPQIFAYPCIVGFGNVMLGNKSYTANVNIYNTGRVSANILDILFLNHDDTFKVLSNLTYPFMLPAGGRKEILIQASPQTTGLRQNILQIYTDDPNNPDFPVMLSVSGKPETGIGKWPQY